jgi:hypothetical protein
VNLPFSSQPYCTPISSYVPLRVTTSMDAFEGSTNKRVSDDHGPNIGENDRSHGR